VGAPTAVAEDGPTTASWARAANAVCAAVNTSVRKLPAPSSGDGLLADLRAIARLSADEHTKLAAIARPAGDRVSIVRLLTILRTQNTMFSSELIPALRRNDTVAATRLFRKNDQLGSVFNAIARRLGAQICAENPQPSG
jgi:hypothetical protein